MCCGRRAGAEFHRRRRAVPGSGIASGWNGGNIGERLKVPVLGADTEAVRAELDKQTSLQPTTPREAVMTRIPGTSIPTTRSFCAKWACATACSCEEVSVDRRQAALDRDEYAAAFGISRSARSCRGRPFRIRRRARDHRDRRMLPGAYGIALTLNERGVNEALASGVAEVATVVSATEEHSQANADRSRNPDRQRQAALRTARRQRPDPW